MGYRTIPQRELRNNVTAVLREAESGTVFTVTVRGRPVAQLGPPEERRGPKVDVARATVERILAMPLDTEALAADLDAAEPPIDFEDDPWQPR
jgi:prevent-host-death family protein